MLHGNLGNGAQVRNANAHSYSVDYIGPASKSSFTRSSSSCCGTEEFFFMVGPFPPHTASSATLWVVGKLDVQHPLIIYVKSGPREWAKRSLFHIFSLASCWITRILKGRGHRVSILTPISMYVIARNCKNLIFFLLYSNFHIGLLSFICDGQLNIVDVSLFNGCIEEFRTFFPP